MSDKKDYFDITELFKVMDANEWTEGKKFMKFWAEGKAKIAVVDPAKNNKSTIGANLNMGLCIYTIQWSWLNRFPSANLRYQELFRQRIKSPEVRELLASKYGRQFKANQITSPFNDWLMNDLTPGRYFQYIKNHQLQYLEVNPLKLNGRKFNDLVAAVNGFNFYVFYKGQVINAAAYRDQVKCIKNPLAKIPAKQRSEIESHLIKPQCRSVVYVTHVGVYAGDIYEFNGAQYLATWNIVDDTVEISTWDYLRGTSDTDDPEDLAITNETFNIYRKKTGKGGDFLVLSPIKLTPYTMIIPVN